MCCVSTAWGGCEVGTRVRHTGHASPDVQHGENSRVHGLGTAAEEPAGPVAARPAARPRSRVRAVPGPAAPRPGESGTAVARTRTAPAGPCRWMRMAATGSLRRLRGRSLPPGARRGRRLVPGRPGGHSHAHREDGRQFLENEPRHRRSSPRRVRLPAGLSPGPACLRQRDRLAARGCRAPPSRARQSAAGESRRRRLPGIKCLADRERVFVLGDE